VTVADETSTEKITALADDIPVPLVIQRIADSEDRRLAWHFFVFFSRMEYALKRTRSYLKNSPNAEPNWDKFGSDYDERFRQALSPLTALSVEYFEASPPRKQTQVEGTMGWSEPRRRGENDKQLKWLLQAIRTVRNNLFHGGKFPLITMPDPSRDRDLLMHSLAILNAVLGLDAEVKSNFEHLDDI